MPSALPRYFGLWTLPSASVPTLIDALYFVKYFLYSDLMTQLSAPLNTNAAFSIFSGVLLTAIPTKVGQWLTVDADLILRAFGVFLIGHGALLFWAARRTNPRPFATANLVAIAPYPIAMVALAASGVIDTSLGRTLVLADGAVIAAIATWHAILLRRDGGSTTLSPA